MSDTIEPVPLENLSVMIVDDVENMRTLVRTILRYLGVTRIFEAKDGNSALALSEQHAVDLILSDWDMKPMDGVAFIHQLRRCEANPNRRVPVIMVSGNTTLDEILLARDIGISDFLAKPISVRQLYRRIEQTRLNPRCFIEVATYIGPDRRRSKQPVRKDRRRPENPIPEGSALEESAPDENDIALI